MADIRPTEKVLVEGGGAALFLAVVGGWRAGLSVLLITLAMAYAFRNLGPRAGLDQ